MSLSNSTDIAWYFVSLDASSDLILPCCGIAELVWRREKMSTQKLSFPMADLVTQQVLQTLGDKAGQQFCTTVLTCQLLSPLGLLLLLLHPSEVLLPVELFEGCQSESAFKFNPFKMNHKAEVTY